MPELPDVAGFKTYLDSTALHQPIAKTTVQDERVLKGVSRQKLAARLKDNELKGTQRHGKFLFAEMADGGHLVFHFGMTGYLRYYHDGKATPDYARVILHFQNGRHLAYISKRMLGRVSLVEDLERFVKGQELGPDAMDDALDEEWFLEALQGRRGTVKSTLMDQSTIAGIGNVYADEILFQSGIHPATSVNELTEDEKRDLFRHVRDVMKRASGRPVQNKGFPDDFLLNQRREQNKCPRCGDQLSQVEVSGRSSYFCPNCQKKK